MTTCDQAGSEDLPDAPDAETGTDYGRMERIAFQAESYVLVIDGEHINIGAVIRALYTDHRRLARRERELEDVVASERAKGDSHCVQAMQNGQDAIAQRDRAEAAEAKLAEVTKERDEAREAFADKTAAWTKSELRRTAAEATVATLQAQVEAMRGALDEIANQEATHAVDRCTCTPAEMLNEARAIARAALTTEKTNG